MSLKCWRVAGHNVDQMAPRVRRFADSISEIVVVRFAVRVSSAGTLGALNLEDSNELNLYVCVFEVLVIYLFRLYSFTIVDHDFKRFADHAKTTS